MNNFKITNENNWTKENIEFVEKAIEIKNRGMYIESRQLCDKYNEILNKKHPYTQCGTCLRTMVSELETALNKHKREIENKAKIQSSNELKEEDGTTARESENKAAEAKIKDRMAKVRAARGKKK